MPSWKKVITSGSDASLSSLVVTGGITGSLLGTASFATTASYVNLVAGPNITINQSGNSFQITGSGGNAFPYTGSAQITGSLTITGSLNITGSIYNPDSIYFNTTASAVTSPGQVAWDDGYGTLALMLKGGNVDVELGQENVVLVFNNEGTTLNKGEVVFVSGSQGNRPAVNRAIGTSDGYSATTLGFAAESIASGAQGYVTTFGFINGLNTNGNTGGTPVWLSPTTPGGWTTVKPIAPQHTVLLGYIVRVSPTVGSIFVQISNGWELGESHDVLDTTTTASYGDLLVKSGSIWTNSKQLTGSYGITGSLIVSASGATNDLLIGSNKLFVSASGNVGIGTTAPTQLLDVNGTIRSRVTNGAILIGGGETTTSGSPLADGFRVRYEPDLFGGSFDGLVFEKTDVNSTPPDGGIMFANVGSDGVRVPAMSIRGTGRVGIGITTPSASLHVNNTGSSNSFLVEDETNPDSTPFVIDNFGNVGIGTDPSVKLHVSGNSNSVRYEGVDHVYQEYYPQGVAAGRFGYIGYTSSGSTSLNIFNQVSAGAIRFGTENTTRMIISASGNVGIGTTTPTLATLQVNGNVFATSFTGSLFGTATTASYVLNAVSSSFARTASFLNTLNQDLTFNGNLTLNGTASISYLNVVIESASVIYSSGSNQLGDATNDTQTLIGSTVLSGSLQLTGSANLPSITGSVFGTSSWAVSASNALTASVANLALSVGTLNQVLIVSGASTAGTSLVRITQTGAGPAFLVEDEANVDSTPFIIDTDGNVGIGTVTPTQKLDVIGNARISGSLTVTQAINANLTGSVFGTSSWAQNAVTASYIVTAQTASFVTTAQTASYVLQAISASFATSASRAVSASFAPNIYNSDGILSNSRQVDLAGNSILFIDGFSTSTFTVNIDDGSATSGYFQTAPGSITLSATGGGTGKTISISPTQITLEGGKLTVDSTKNTMNQPLEGTSITLSQDLIVTGSVGIGKTTAPSAKLDISGSTLITGSLRVSAGITGSLFGTASWAQNAVTASFITTAQTASYVLNAVSASFASTASILVTTNALITSIATTINSGVTTLYNVPTASYDGAWFDYTVRSGSNARAGTIMGIWSGSAVNYAETTTTDFGNTSGFALGMSIVGANMILSSSATTNGWSFNAIVRSV